MADSKIYMTEVVENTERKFGECLEYYPVEVENAYGDKVWAMFTESDINNAIKRGQKNKEDIPKSFWSKLFG